MSDKYTPPTYDQIQEWEWKQPDECGGYIRARCKDNPKCKQWSEREEPNGPKACGTEKVMGGGTCTKYCNSTICVPKCKY